MVPSQLSANEYDAPTGSSSHDRTRTKTYFESSHHADLVMFILTIHDTEFLSVSVSDLCVQTYTS